MAMAPVQRKGESVCPRTQPRERPRLLSLARRRASVPPIAGRWPDRGGGNGPRRANRTGAAAVAAAVVAAGGAADVILGDLSAPGSARIGGRHPDRFGALDVLVANAGYADARPLEAITRDDLDRALATITGGFFDMTRAARPASTAAVAPAVLAVGAFGPHVVSPRCPDLSGDRAGQGGLEAAVKTLAHELAPAGVPVNAVAPGFIEKEAGTDRAVDAARQAALAKAIPMGRYGRPEEVAAVMAF